MSEKIDFEFGRSIGATHYLPETNDFSDGWARTFMGKKVVTVSGEAWVSPQPHDDRIPMEIPPQTEWSIHNNDKPLKELSDEQAVSIFLEWRKDQRVMQESFGRWIHARPQQLALEVAYRIKPKSERDTFVEQCVNLMTSETERFQEQMFAEVFDAIQRGDIKAPEVSK